MAEDMNQSEVKEDSESLFDEDVRETITLIHEVLIKQLEEKDKLINRLHDELEYYKQETAEKVETQIIKSVIGIHKNMHRRLQSSEWKDFSENDIRREYGYLYEDITDLLEQNNVDSYESMPGELFNPAIHQAKVIKTSEALKDRTIKECISPGYIKGKKVLIPERVIVYQLKEEKDNE